MILGPLLLYLQTSVQKVLRRYRLITKQRSRPIFSSIGLFLKCTSVLVSLIPVLRFFPVCCALVTLAVKIKGHFPMVCRYYFCATTIKIPHKQEVLSHFSWIVFILKPLEIDYWKKQKSKIEEGKNVSRA